MRIPIRDIAVIDRGRTDYGNIGDLVESIKTHGQITAGVVRPTRPDDAAHGVEPDTPWVLVAGGRRYRACALAGVMEFLCENLGDLPPLRQKELELEENLHRKDLAWDEDVLLKKQIHLLKQRIAADEGKPWTQTQTAEVVGETKANMSRDLRLADELERNPELRKAPSKISAVRQLDYERKISERTARVNQTSLRHAASRLVTADMRDFIRTIPTASIDLVFTDFPFGIDYQFSSDIARGKYLEPDTKDNLQDLLTDVIPQMIRVTKPSGWLALMMGSTNYEFLRGLVEACCGTHFEYFAPGSVRCEHSNPGSPCTSLSAEDPEWIWYRPNSRNPSMHPELHAQNQYEKICVVNRGNAVLVRKDLGNVLVHDAVYTERIHEMQRPHSLCMDVVQRLTVGGERVADFCFGSGSALAAAASLQREFLGCDINPKNLEPALVFVTEHMERIAQVG